MAGRCLCRPARRGRGGGGTARGGPHPNEKGRPMPRPTVANHIVFGLVMLALLGGAIAGGALLGHALIH